MTIPQTGVCTQCDRRFTDDLLSCPRREREECRFVRQTPPPSWRRRQVAALFVTVIMVVILLFVWTGEPQRSARASGIVTFLVVTIFLIVLYVLFSHSVYLSDARADVHWKETYLAGLAIGRTVWVPAARPTAVADAPVQLRQPGSHVALYRFRDSLDPGSSVQILFWEVSKPEYKVAIALFVAAFADLLSRKLIEVSVYTRRSWKLWDGWDKENLSLLKLGEGALSSPAVHATGTLEREVLSAVKTVAAGERLGASVYEVVRKAFPRDIGLPPVWPISLVAEELVSRGAITKKGIRRHKVFTQDAGAQLVTEMDKLPELERWMYQNLGMDDWAFQKEVRRAMESRKEVDVRY